MIRVDRVPEPNSFHGECRQRGSVWLARNPNPRRPVDYWSPFKPILAAGFGQRCGYGAMHEAVGTVDHFLSWKHRPELAYEWSNYRYASAWLNSSKQGLDGAVLDPFEVGDGWFRVLLPSLQLVLTDRVPATHRRLAAYTLERLHLRDDERVIRQRRGWYEMYQAGELSLEGLRRMAPLIAEAVEQAGDAGHRDRESEP